ncbi:MAG: MarC family protein [Desulfuromonadaceae bacterium]|nr:MarC family protein [Desulfuromonadaceae bacterium]
MLETLVVAFTTFFATIGPVDVAALFAVLAPTATLEQRRSMAVRGTAIATLILLLFALFGDAVLRSLGVSLAALQLGGGILLLLIGIDMVFVRPSGGTTTTREETREATSRPDLAVFPLATPLIAGPGAISATMLLMAQAKGHWQAQILVVLVLLLVLLLTLALLLIASRVQRFLGVTGLHVISRVFGVLLTALAAQFIIDGVRHSGLLG